MCGRGVQPNNCGWPSRASETGSIGSRSMAATSTAAYLTRCGFRHGWSGRGQRPNSALHLTWLACRLSWFNAHERAGAVSFATHDKAPSIVGNHDRLSGRSAFQVQVRVDVDDGVEVATG